MADISLDDFIKKKKLNVKVRLNNNIRPKPKLQQNLRTGPNKKNLPQKLQKNSLGARSRLGPKAITDARDKIITIKKNGGGDARNKIVKIQVEKGTFDARSLLQRQHQKSGRKKGNGGNSNDVFVSTSGGALDEPGSLTRTLSNPAAHKRGQIRATPGGLQITRPIPSTQVSLTANSLQVTKRNKPMQGKTPTLADAVPIIQIRNDRYRNPSSQVSASYLASQQSSFSDPAYEEYDDLSYPSSRGGYKDWDDPQYNPSAINIPEVPKVHVSNLKTIEAAGMRPVSRIPPGAATLSLSQPTKPHPQKTVVSPAVKISTTGLKRKPATVPEMSGPLRLGRGGGPGIDLNPSPNKKMKPAPTGDLVELVALETEGSEIISPLQGYRVMVSNLFNGVTQDDIIELFGAVGPLKKAKLLKPGIAEVVYTSKQNAVSAVQKYHSRELDGQPMYVKMTTPAAAVVRKAPETDPDITGEALRLYKKPSGMGSLPIQPIETPTIHRALFKVGPPGPNKSVKFTVKI